MFFFHLLFKNLLVNFDKLLIKSEIDQQFANQNFPLKSSTAPTLTHLKHQTRQRPPLKCQTLD